MTKVIDPKDQETTYGYSALSELTAVTQHLGQTVAYAYDPRGRLARVTNARGQALVHVYEPFGALAEVRHYPTAADADAGTNLARTVSYAYDASGNLTETGDTDYSSSAPTLETTVYDELDRPELVTVHYVPGGDRTLESGYDRYGNRKNLVFTDGSDVLSHTWTYDKLNHLAQADLASPSPLAFTYYANDDLETITHGNGVTTEYTYFPEGPVETITVESPSEQLLGLTYAVDKVMNITGITEQHEAAGPNHVYSYGYDALDRLTSATYPTALGLPASESFAYDDAGNREDPADPSAYAYDANNRITASPGKAWVYDGDGNPVSVNAGLSTEETFAHDASNRMRGYSNAATSAAASYLYDPFARRMKKTVNGTATWFIWDGDQLLAEFDGSGERGRRYTYTGGSAPAEQVIAGAIGEDVQPVHTDHLDTPRSLSGAGGESVWRAAHRAFGTTTANEDPDGNLADVLFSIRFPGQFEDPESGIHDNRFRHYSPKLGRYLSADPIGQNSGANVYAYALSRPLSVVDPLGLDWIEYNGTRVTLYGGDPGDKSVKKLECPASSGKPPYQDPAFQDERGSGPVPEGDYEIDLTPDPGRVANYDRDTGDLYSNPRGGIERIPTTGRLNDGDVVTYPGWGSWRARLTPSSGTNTRRRSNFYLHDSNKGYTQGCVETCSSLLSELEAYRSLGNPSISVRIRYSGPSTSGGIRSTP